MDKVWYEKWIKEVRTRKEANNPFTLKEYVTMCIDLEAHETETHNKYADAARKERNQELAAVFHDLANGEDFFSGKFEKFLKEWR